MKIIYIHQKEKGEQKRYRVLVDDGDYDWLNDLKGWSVISGKYVVLRKHMAEDNALTVGMARLIMLFGLGDPRQTVIHIDKNPLNMQRTNLYIVEDTL